MRNCHVRWSASVEERVSVFSSVGRRSSSQSEPPPADIEPWETLLA